MTSKGNITITYIILAHDDPVRVEFLADNLLSQDPTGQVIIHFDRKSDKKKFNYLAETYDSEERCHILKKRVRCGWGLWGLVEASLRALQYAQDTHPTDYYYLLSEYCFPTQPLQTLKEFLYSSNGKSFIEINDSNWIQAGIREDRYLYYHFLDKRRFPKLHRWCYLLQKSLGLKKSVPDNLDVKFGSQWWCLHASAVQKVLEKNETVTNITKLLKYAWIPDECYFQTIINTKDKSERHINKTLTYYKFDQNGKALKVENINKIPQGYFFARKYKT